MPGQLGTVKIPLDVVLPTRVRILVGNTAQTLFYKYLSNYKCAKSCGGAWQHAVFVYYRRIKFSLGARKDFPKEEIFKLRHEVEVFQ